MGVAFLFPGQGSQYPGMLHQLPEHSAVNQTINEASELLKEDVLSFDTEEKLQSTVSVQLSLLIASVATARALQTEGAEADMVAGHSVGAFGAAVIAGALDFKDALSLVKKRGELMEQAYPIGFGMGVVLGLSERNLLSIMNDLPSDALLYLANLNSPDQITITGEVSSIKQLFQAAQSKGARKVHLLNVSVPSHCPLLQTVSVELEKHLQGVSLKEPSIPYAGNRTARALRNAHAIREDLALSISNPVRWYDATSVLFELGARLFIEMAPGHTLTVLTRSSFPAARSLSVSDNGLKSASILIQREKAKAH
jgi:malonate decarboxylase epsilon subunit